MSAAGSTKDCDFSASACLSSLWVARDLSVLSLRWLFVFLSFSAFRLIFVLLSFLALALTFRFTIPFKSQRLLSDWWRLLLLTFRIDFSGCRLGLALLRRLEVSGNLSHKVVKSDLVVVLFLVSLTFLLLLGISVFFAGCVCLRWFFRFDWLAPGLLVLLWF